MNEDRTAEIVETNSGKEENQVESLSDDLEIEGHSEDVESQASKPQSDRDRILAYESELALEGDRYIRLVAEFTNYRRRVEQEMSRARHKGQADLLSGFLEVLDDLERVSCIEETESTNVAVLIEGIELVKRKFQQELEAMGVEVVDPCAEIFNPNFMEAMVTVPTDLTEEDGQVCEVFQKGYRLGDQLLRAARVSVLKEE